MTVWYQGPEGLHGGNNEEGSCSQKAPKTLMSQLGVLDEYVGVTQHLTAL